MKIRIRETYDHLWVVAWDVYELTFSSKENAYEFVIQLTK